MAKKKASTAAAVPAEPVVTAEADAPVETPAEAPVATLEDATLAPAKAAKAAAVTSVTVKYRDHIGMETERTFSQEVHGDDFAKLAEEFKATNASKIIE